MYNTIKTLLGQGKSLRWIASELGIHRRTVTSIKKKLEQDEGPPEYVREKRLCAYQDVINKYLEQDLTVELIRRRLVSKHGLAVSYSTVRRYVASLREKETYVPLHAAPGEEAQVDFGYLGLFTMPDGTKVKVWVFCMVLSHSRYAYYEVVLDQKVATFIRCHIHAFEYFGGVPEKVKLDNLKAGVLEPNFYEPLLQEQYSEFLSHYGCVGSPCRVRKPEHKGKVESGVKYVKNNFGKGLEEDQRYWAGLQGLLRKWTDEVCNRRCHGTTHRIPAEVFEQVEQPVLLSLPAVRYEIYRLEERTVGPTGHITFDYNYYSVPHTLAGASLRVKSNGTVLRICQGAEQVAIHNLVQGKGQYVTRQEHLPPHKREQSLEVYQDKMSAIGPAALALLEACRLEDAHHWKEKARGVLSLKRWYETSLIERACQLALSHQLHSFRSVQSICRHLNKQPPAPDTEGIASNPQGYHHDLSLYDQL